jgi:hypothetical protein
MDRVALGIARDAHDLLAVEIRGRASTPQAARFAGPPDVQRAGVVFREDRNRRDPRLGGAASDPDRDLAAVGDQQSEQGGTFIVPPASRSGRAGPERAEATDQTGVARLESGPSAHPAICRGALRADAGPAAVAAVVFGRSARPAFARQDPPSRGTCALLLAIPFRLRNQRVQTQHGDTSERAERELGECPIPHRVRYRNSPHRT